MARVSKWLVLGLTYVGLLTGFILLFVGVALTSAEERLNHPITIAGLVALGLGVLAFLGGFAAWMFLLHRAWSAIQDGHARTTPGKAVGFMFIPLFNIFWVFRAFQGFAQDFNQFRDRHGLPCEPLNESHFTAYCMCVCLGNVPYVGCLANIGVLIMIGIVGSAMADRVNLIADLQGGAYPYVLPVS